MNTATRCEVCGGFAVLYRTPHENAGIWECQNPDCGASEAHVHDDIEIQGDEYKCLTCGLTLDKDPNAEAAQAFADMLEEDA